MIISSVWKAACRSHLQFCSSASLFLPLCILRLDDPSLPLFLCLSLSLSISFVPASPPPALHQPTPAIFTPHTSVAALIQPQTAAGSIAKWIIQQQSTSPSPSLPLPLSPPLSLSMHSSSRGSSEAEGPYWAGPRLSTSQALYWGVYGALCCQRSALPSPSSIILGSRAAITAQTGGQSQPSRKLYRRWREKQRREKLENHSVSVAASLKSDLTDIFCTFWVHDNTGINQGQPVWNLIKSWSESLSHESTYNHVKIIIVEGIWQQ